MTFMDPDTPSTYAPRCGHHGNPLTWLGDEHRWRCPYCFPELFDEPDDELIAAGYTPEEEA